jgi:hypothetical protein
MHAHWYLLFVHSKTINIFAWYVGKHLIWTPQTHVKLTKGALSIPVIMIVDKKS